jgi:hypothetical protein
MKTKIQTAVTSIAAIIALTVGAAAADQALVVVSNPHGQFTALYRSVDAPTVALNIGNQGLGNNTITRSKPDLTLGNRATGHGQNVIQYWSAE